MDEVLREVQVRTFGRGAQLVDNGEKKWEVSQLLFIDDMVLVAGSKKLESLVGFVEERN